MPAVFIINGALMKKKSKLHKQIQFEIFFIPALVFFTTFTIIPLIKTILYSFTDFNGITHDYRFVGLKNYIGVFNDAVMKQAIANTLLYTVATVVLINLIAIPLAIALDKHTKAKSIERAIFFFPSVISGLLLGYLWGYILSPMKTGALNAILANFGIASHGWTSSPWSARICIVLVAIWTSVGWHATVYLAYLQAIPSEYYEAASIDGATRWNQFIYITIPLLAPGMTVNTLLLLTNGFRILYLYCYANYYPEGDLRETVWCINSTGYNLYPGSHVCIFYPIFNNAQTGNGALSIMRKNEQKEKRFNISDLILLPFCLIYILPFYYLVVNTFKSMSEMSYSPLSLPKEPILSNYKGILSNPQIYHAFGNTLIITLCSVLLIVVIGEMAAYPIVFNENKLNNAFMVYLMIGFLVPFQAILLSLFEVMQTLHLINNIWGMILFYGNGSALTVFLAVGYMRSIPRDLVEAAIVDGCSIPMVFFRIIFPLMTPITATSIIFNTMWIWNDFIAPNIFLSSRRNGTIVLEVFRAKGQFSVDWPRFMTLSVVSIFPILIFYLFMQKYIIRGLTAGAVKG